MHMPRFMYGGNHPFSYMLLMSLSENQMNMCLCPKVKILLKNSSFIFLVLGPCKIPSFLFLSMPASSRLLFSLVVEVVFCLVVFANGLLSFFGVDLDDVTKKNKKMST